MFKEGLRKKGQKMKNKNVDKAQLVVERVAEGVLNKIEGGMKGHFITQCAFCCRSHESEHDDHCPVKIAKEIMEDEEFNN